MKRIEAINDFVIKFANVNGSGSASANELFAKAILRMGVPVSPRNIFPSNIQGLPTWYEVRVTEQGWLGRRGGIDMMVAMNPQTWDRDVAELAPGGYLAACERAPERLRVGLLTTPVIAADAEVHAACLDAAARAAMRAHLIDSQARYCAFLRRIRAGDGEAATG